MIPEGLVDPAFSPRLSRTIDEWLLALAGELTLAIIAIAMTFLYRSNGFVSIHFYIATALGIGFAMLLMSALMGLVFLSAGTGHDDAIIDPLEDEREI